MENCLKTTLVCGFGLAIAAASGLVSGRALAQVTPDGTLGAESSVVNRDVIIKGLPSDRIEGGARRGANLFHSFIDFNVAAQRGVYFANPTGVNNILSRVTGSNASNIAGRLGVLGGANLFLLNPNGIIFGPNASLDVAGSFMASTGRDLLMADGTVYGATNPTAASLLTVSVPLGVQFGKDQPRAIVNSGNLTTGNNLALVGGTVVSTGQLNAPTGNVVVATAPAESAVNLSPAGQLLSVTTPSTTVPSTLSSAPLEPLAQGNGTTSGLTLNETGQVALAGSGLPVVEGDVAVQQLIARSATLAASHNLTLVESQLQTSGDLNLQAGDTVRVRDSVALPFSAQAGGNLTIQGNQGIDILALNHPEVPFQSGGNLSLISDGIVSGDAHFGSGGSFSILNLLGQPGTFISLYDPIISSGGDVTFDSYTGTALKVEATGSIQGGNIRITGPDCFVGVPGCGIPANDPDRNILTSEPAVILRAGQPLDTSPNIPPTNPVGGSNFRVEIASPEKPPKSITVGTINTSVATGKAGDVTLTALGDITTGGIQAFVGSGGTGNAGNITLTSTGSNGVVDTTKGTLYSSAQAGNGGTVKITADGNILTAGIQSLAITGNGGDVILNSTGGKIDTTAFAPDFSGRNISGLQSVAKDGKAGDITLTALGDITTGGIQAFVGSGGTGNAGNITLTSTGSNGVVDTTKGTLYSSAQAGNGGTVKITADGNILTAGIQSLAITGNGGDVILNSTGGKIDATAFAPDFSGRNFSGLQSLSTNGKAGDINLTASKGIISGTIVASSNTVGQGGSITLSSTSNTFGNNPTDPPAIDTSNVTITSQNLHSTPTTAPDGTTTTTPDGVAGDITLNAMSGNIRSGSVNARSNSSSGDFSNIFITSQKGSVFVEPGARLSTENEPGTAGNIEINAPKQVSIGTNPLNASISRTILNSQGSQGFILIGNNQAVADITINNSTLTTEITTGSKLQEPLGGRIQITAAPGGTIRLNSSTLNSKINGIATPEEGVEIEARNGTITLDRSFIETNTSSTNSSNDGNPITLNAQTVSLNNQSSLTATTSGAGIGGIISIRNDTNPATSVDISNGSFLNAGTTGSANGGFITVNSNNLNLLTGGQLRTTSTGAGKAGGINVDVVNKVTISGSGTFVSNPVQSNNSGLFAQNTVGREAGNITVKTSQLAVADRGEISVNAPQGIAGNLYIFADQVKLNQATLSANTGRSPTDGTGANIFLLGKEAANNDPTSSLLQAVTSNKSPQEINAQLGNGTISPLSFLIMENGSKITATADPESDASGGNIFIKTQVLLAPRTRNKIEANAGKGNGGNIYIFAKPLGIYNIEFRSTGTLTLNDITATSLSGRSGIVDITLPDINPARGLNQLAIDVADASKKITPICPIAGQQGANNQFVVSGRGGLPETPASILSSNVLVGEQATVATQAEATQPNPTASATKNPSGIEAQGVELGANGAFILTARASSGDPHPSWEPFQRCLQPSSN